MVAMLDVKPMAAAALLCALPLMLGIAPAAPPPVYGAAVCGAGAVLVWSGDLALVRGEKRWRIGSAAGVHALVGDGTSCWVIQRSGAVLRLRGRRLVEFARVSVPRNDRLGAVGIGPSGVPWVALERSDALVAVASAPHIAPLPQSGFLQGTAQGRSFMWMPASTPRTPRVVPLSIPNPAPGRIGISGPLPVFYSQISAFAVQRNAIFWAAAVPSQMGFLDRRTGKGSMLVLPLDTDPDFNGIAEVDRSVLALSRYGLYRIVVGKPPIRISFAEDAHGLVAARGFGAFYLDEGRVVFCAMRTSWRCSPSRFANIQWLGLQHGRLYMVRSSSSVSIVPVSRT